MFWDALLRIVVFRTVVFWAVLCRVILCALNLGQVFQPPRQPRHFFASCSVSPKHNPLASDISAFRQSVTRSAARARIIRTRETVLLLCLAAVSAVQTSYEHAASIDWSSPTAGLPRTGLPLIDLPLIDLPKTGSPGSIDQIDRPDRLPRPVIVGLGIGLGVGFGVGLGVGLYPPNITRDQRLRQHSQGAIAVNYLTVSPVIFNLSRLFVGTVMYRTPAICHIYV